ncbi:MAG: hypothetical protein AB4911_07915 [Oscillochloridaceae bacterium umkhey_bin13]
MEADAHTHMSHVRLLEGWLPLAQDANQAYGWYLAAPELEALLLAAAPALMQTLNPLAARAVLWRVYQQRQEARR